MTPVSRDSTPSTSVLATMPEDLVRRENDAIRVRREAAGLEPDGGAPLGLALSGGGIRSATFGLGVLQALAAAKLLRRFDYLSTVSGGGYIGAFLGRLFSRSTKDLRDALPRPPRSEDAASPRVADLVERILTEPSSRPHAFLRENGRYLSPNGSGDLLLAGAVALRNWVSVHLVIGTFLLTFFLLAQAVRILVLSLSAWVGGLHPGIASSGWFFLPALAGLFFVVPLGWAYWLGQPKSPRERWSCPPALGGVVVLVASLALLGLSLTPLVYLPPDCFPVLLVVAGVTVIAFIAWRVALPKDKASGRLAAFTFFPTPDPDRDRARNSRLSRWLKVAFVVFLVTLAFAIVDLAGEKLYRALAAVCFDPAELLDAWSRTASASGIAGLIVFGRKLATFLAGRAEKARLSLPLEAVASLAAVALAALLLVGHSFLSWGFAASWTGEDAALSATFLCVLGAGILASIFFGRTPPFLNQSSLQALYAARLARAYMGASNPARWTDARVNVTEPIAGDGFGMDSYRPDLNGGPLHIVNVTLNETVSGKSHVEQRDRKGLGMAIGPFATSVGKRSHALHVKTADGLAALEPLDPPKGEYAIFTPRSGSEPIPAESLALETWISISGAAVSTGLGARTSLGLSLLCGFFNVRLGYWWDSGMDPSKRSAAVALSPIDRIRRAIEGLLPVQMHLFNELLATFRGPNARRWYLTDGGHFENTGAYELIRRRLPLIVVCDDGADPDYQLADLANLVRKARLDFQTEISFLDETELSASSLDSFFGALEDLRRDAPGRFSRKHAALARISYPDGSEGRLVLLKPSLTGRESRDVLHYHEAHPGFPQEPTSDQYFDEAQWESYRRLGEVIGAGVAPALAKLLATEVPERGGER